MATKIRGITVEIGGDTTGLQHSLQDVNKEIKSTQNQLKDVNKLLKMDPGNIDLLKQKQDLLAQSVEQTAKKLDTLKDAQTAFVDNGGDINSDGYKALQREIASTEQALKKAKSEAAGFSAEIEAARAKVDSFGQGAKNFSQATKGMSTAAAGVLGALGGMALKSVTAADDLNTLAKQSGLTTAELQKIQYASDLVDVSMEDIVSAQSKLTKSMASGSEAFTTLGISTTNADGSLRSSNEVFYETLAALGQVTNETERDVLAMELFGKGAASLSGIIDDGGASLKAYGDEAERAGLIMSQDTLDGLNAVNDQIDELKAKAAAEIANTGAKAMEALLPIFDKVVDKISAVLDWIGGLDEGTLKMILTIAGVVAAISPIAGIIGSISGAVSGFLGFLPKLQTAFSSVLSFAAANPMLVIAGAVAALVALIIANWDKIKPVLQSVWDFVKKMINGFLGLINSLIDGVNGLIAGLNKLHFELPSWVPGIGGKSFGINIPTIPHIPLLAEGGVLSSGSAIVGERGAELLTVGNGSATVQPLTNNYTTNNYQQGTPNISVNFTGSLAQLARVLQPEIVAESARVGGGWRNG